jgi:nucleoside 2-deoxyribosyltransferase
MDSLKVYLAGPFFNSESVRILQEMLKVLEKESCKVFAPMRDGILCPKNADAAMRRKVFELDIKKIEEADLVVALLDYPLPINQNLLLRVRSPNGIKDVSVHFPDSGTVFEMGYAFALSAQRRSQGQPGLPVIGFTSCKQGLNLMVTECCAAIATSFQELQDLVRSYRDGKGLGVRAGELADLEEI